MDWTERARRFRDLHRAGSPFVLPSVAPLGVAELTQMGFVAVQAHAVGEVDTSRLLTCGVLERAEDVRDWVDAGCCGVVLDDAELTDEAAVALVRSVATQSPDLVITARSYRGTLDARIEQLRRFRDAGAHVVEAPGLRRAEDILRVVEEVDVPVNVTLGLGGVPPSSEALASLGVARISTGAVLPALGIEPARRALREILEHGTFEFLVELEA